MCSCEICRHRLLTTAGCVFAPSLCPSSYPSDQRGCWDDPRPFVFVTLRYFSQRKLPRACEFPSQQTGFNPGKMSVLTSKESLFFPKESLRKIDTAGSPALHIPVTLSVGRHCPPGLHICLLPSPPGGSSRASAGKMRSANSWLLAMCWAPS